MTESATTNARSLCNKCETKAGKKDASVDNYSEFLLRVLSTVEKFKGCTRVDHGPISTMTDEFELVCASKIHEGKICKFKTTLTSMKCYVNSSDPEHLKSKTQCELCKKDIACKNALKMVSDRVKRAKKTKK